jgi:hypothetical protein
MARKEAPEQQQVDRNDAGGRRQGPRRQDPGAGGLAYRQRREGGQEADLGQPEEAVLDGNPYGLAHGGERAVLQDEQAPHRDPRDEDGPRPRTGAQWAVVGRPPPGGGDCERPQDHRTGDGDGVGRGQEPLRRRPGHGEEAGDGAHEVELGHTGHEQQRRHRGAARAYRRGRVQAGRQQPVGKPQHGGHGRVGHQGIAVAQERRLLPRRRPFFDDRRHPPTRPAR